MVAQRTRVGTLSDAEFGEWRRVVSVSHTGQKERRDESERRSRRVALFAHERRTGFDRRRDYPITGALRDRPQVLLGLLVALNLLSGLDFVFTYLQLNAGVATEGNPVMASMFTSGPWQAWLFKTTVMLLVSIGIWRGRHTRAILEVAIGALGIYVALIGYHVTGMAASGLLWALVARISGA